MNKKLLRYYHPSLRKNAERAEVGRETDELIEMMKRTLYKEGGVGIAGPQIGILKRIIVVNLDEQVVAFLNPEITEKSEELIQSKEGCLSLKGIWLDVSRSRKIKVKALTPEGEEVEMDAQDLLAVVFQHEIDHLNGKLFIDRVGFLIRVKAIASYFFRRND